jgi:hypothetical protein
MMRQLRPDGNPLRRTADRIEAAVLAVLLAVLLAGVPLAAVAAAGQVAAGSVRAERAQSSWRQVPAVLLQDAPQGSQPLGQESMMPLVRARWTAPDGTSHVGQVYAPDGAAAGSTVTVWTTRSGSLRGEPVKRGYVVAQEMIAALWAAALVAFAVAVAGFLARRALDRRRLAAWDAEWSRTGPLWTGRV